MARGATGSLRRASTKARRIAKGSSLWLASTVSSSSTGKFGCCDSEHSHPSPSRTKHRTFQDGTSSSIRAIAASVQASAAISRAMRTAGPAPSSAATRGHAPAANLEKSCGVGLPASRSSSSSRSSRTPSIANATTQSRKRASSAPPHKVASKAIKKPEEPRRQDM
jgi:hypothetical protein